MPSLAEEIFLLSLLEKKETIRVLPSLCLPFALAGATLMDLVFSGFARLEDDRLILLPDAGQVETESLKMIVERIQKVVKPKKLDHWIYVLGARGNRLTKDIVISLVNQGFLIADGKTFHWKPSDSSLSSTSSSAKYLLKRHLRDAVFCGEPVDEHYVALLSFLEACGILDHIFTVDEIIAARKQVKTLKKNDQISEPFMELMDAFTNAVEFATAAAVSV